MMGTTLSVVRCRSSVARVAGLVLLLVLVPQMSWACPVCYGADGDPMVKATNNGIWVLLGFIGFVQLGFVGLFYSFWRRQKAQKRFRDQFHVIR
jgi:hypothetical protein